jgi:hypothetical protein
MVVQLLVSMVYCPSYMKTNKRDTTSLILHGHFYQPPRENPQTGLIGKQLTASPFPDWNERIHADCYKANSLSRYLSGVRRILSLTNNYAYLSFNFGPTLLSWMEKYHRNTYRLILEADKQSKERLGFGNAIAQAYNHTILPLCTEEDARVQIRWGLEDFAQRFSRKADGIWLPETAISPMVIDILAEEGVSYVILSPWQCRAIEDKEKGRVDLEGRGAPYDRPFLLQGSKGKTISAFFYNPQLAEGISFGHYLRDADSLYQRLVAIKQEDKPSLLHTATDGEIYGHHEPYGDMALSALIKKVEERDDFTFTNYATYLKDHPATELAYLHDGEEAKGTSWSCIHGVSRWYKDCGCHTGGEEGWNQKWRTPLRLAFDNLSKEIDAIFTNEVTKALGNAIDPRELLYQSSVVVSHLKDMDSFLSSYTNDAETKHTLAMLLEGQKYKHFSYTSCGWFFNDLAGLEPKQNIAYALMAVDLYNPFSKKDLLGQLLEDLDKAKANRKQDGSGKTLAKEILKNLPGEVEAALFFALNRRIARKQDYADTYGWFQLESYTEENEHADKLLVTNTETLAQFICTARDPNPKQATLEYIMEIHERGTDTVKTTKIGHNQIPLRMRDQLFDQIDRSVCTLDYEALRRLSKDVFHYATLAKNVPYLPMGSLYEELIGCSLSSIKSLFIYGSLDKWDEYKQDFALMLDFLKKYGKQPDIDLVASIFHTEMTNLGEKIQEDGLYERNIRFILEFLQIVRERGFQPDLTALQNAVYPYVSMQKQPKKGDILSINALAKELNFDVYIS